MISKKKVVSDALGPFCQLANYPQIAANPVNIFNFIFLHQFVAELSLVQNLVFFALTLLPQ